jgi:hypothetical protein
MRPSWPTGTDGGHPVRVRPGGLRDGSQAVAPPVTLADVIVIEGIHNGTVPPFERHGFARTRRIGKNRWVVTKVVRGSGL